MVPERSATAFGLLGAGWPLKACFHRLSSMRYAPKADAYRHSDGIQTCQRYAGVGILVHRNSRADRLRNFCTAPSYKCPTPQGRPCDNHFHFRGGEVTVDERLRTLETARRKALWALADLQPGNPRAVQVLNARSKIDKAERLMGRWMHAPARS